MGITIVYTPEIQGCMLCFIITTLHKINVFKSIIDLVMYVTQRNEREKKPTQLGYF